MQDQSINLGNNRRFWVRRKSSAQSSRGREVRGLCCKRRRSTSCKSEHRAETCCTKQHAGGSDHPTVAAACADDGNNESITRRATHLISTKVSVTVQPLPIEQYQKRKAAGTQRRTWQWSRRWWPWWRPWRRPWWLNWIPAIRSRLYRQPTAGKRAGEPQPAHESAASKREAVQELKLLLDTWP